MTKIRKQEALDYHSDGRPGKIEVIPTKPTSSQRDLSLAYSPGVAEPCLEIADDIRKAYKYTAKGNLVAVISNGTAVLGLGDIGPVAGKPVMEGKGLLFKIFSDIDVFDIELDAKDARSFIETVQKLAPTFGGINLEDIKAPMCFEIEKELKKTLDIPIMHDDQHGTAIISSAALLNALDVSGKDIGTIRIVVSGAGAAAISCANLYISLGARRENIIMLDSKGVLSPDRKDLDKYKSQFINKKTKARTLEQALEGADVFLGLSKGNIVSKKMIQSMAKDPIVFALANPTPEISYEKAMSARDDLIMATGRSDTPNQVNNVLGFPYIFRGALDVRSTAINEEMKIAAVKAIANLAKETVPEMVNEAYGQRNIVYGRDYIIPKPLDPRLISTVAPAVAKAAIDSKIAQKTIKDWGAYASELDKRLGLDNKLIRNVTERAKKNPKRVVFAEADHYRILKAAQIVYDEGIAKPILLGKKHIIEALIEENHLDLEGVPIVDPKSDEERKRRLEYADLLWAKRRRRGFTEFEARKIMRERNWFGAAMVQTGDADAMISGITRNYRDTIRPALQLIGRDEDVNLIAGMYILIDKRGPIFFADTTVNFKPTARDLVDITVLAAKTVKRFKLVPRIALLSYSNFGSSEGEDAEKVREAVAILHKEYPGLVVDGELQANFALNNEMMMDKFPFSKLVNKSPNVLIFPNLAAGNIAYKLMQEMSDTETVGPLLMGMKKAVHILQLGSGVREIVNMVTIAVTDAQTREK